VYIYLHIYNRDQLVHNTKSLHNKLNKAADMFRCGLRPSSEETYRTLKTLEIVLLCYCIILLYYYHFKCFWVFCISSLKMMWSHVKTCREFCKVCCAVISCCVRVGLCNICKHQLGLTSLRITENANSLLQHPNRCVLNIWLLCIGLLMFIYGFLPLYFIICEDGLLKPKHVWECTPWHVTCLL
jgi:hypothetical protein